MIRPLLCVSAFVGLALSCTPPKDDDPTPVLMSAYNEGSFSIRIFELKVDSTFRYERHLSGTDYDTRGAWSVVNDTFVLHAKDDLEYTYGRIVVQDPLPLFIWDPRDSALLDMANPACRLLVHDPPENIDFQVNRR